MYTLGGNSSKGNKEIGFNMKQPTPCQVYAKGKTWLPWGLMFYFTLIYATTGVSAPATDTQAHGATL